MWKGIVSVWNTVLEFLGIKKRSAVRIAWWVNNNQLPETTTMILITNDQRVTLRIQPLDRYGNPARIDGVPVWTQSDATLGTLEPSADGLTCTFTSLGPLGTTQVNVAVDAAIGPEVRTLFGVLDVQIESGEAVSVGIIAGTPEQKPLA